MESRIIVLASKLLFSSFFCFINNYGNLSLGHGRCLAGNIGAKNIIGPVIFVNGGLGIIGIEHSNDYSVDKQPGQKNKSKADQYAPQQLFGRIHQTLVARGNNVHYPGNHNHADCHPNQDSKSIFYDIVYPFNQVAQGAHRSRSSSGTRNNLRASYSRKNNRD
jgi:hypothetical protein